MSAEHQENGRCCRCAHGLFSCAYVVLFSHQLAGGPISAHLLVLGGPRADHSQKLFVLIVSVCDNHHKNLSRLLYSVYANKIGIQGCGAEVLTRHAPSGELYAKRTWPCCLSTDLVNTEKKCF